VPYPEAHVIAWLLPVFGVGLVVVALSDISLTVLYARSGASLLSDRFHKGVWHLFRSSVRVLPRYRDRLLAYAGPSLLVLTVLLWVLLLLVGFALIVWPALGSAIQASSGGAATGFAAALYYAGFSLTTLGTGDVVPLSAPYRLLTVLMAAIGFSVLTLSLTFFTSVYSALVRRNTFALGLQHRTAGSADAAVLLSYLGPGGDFSDARSELTVMAEELTNLYESHHFYPVLHYFRFQENVYALARIALLTLDTATLIRSALDERAYPSLVRSTSVAALWGGGMQLLEGVAATFLPQPQPERAEELEQDTEKAWRAHFDQAVGKFRAEGIAVVADVAAGADKYVALCRERGAYVVAFAEYMLYDWNAVAVQETDPQHENLAER
jgi:hypothetical protein